jgi:hypothetical protein
MPPALVGRWRRQGASTVEPFVGRTGATSAMTQALDLPGVRNRVRMLMSWPDHPQMILRVGWPPAADTTPQTPRRRVAAVLTMTRPDPSGSESVQREVNGA